MKDIVAVQSQLFAVDENYIANFRRMDGVPLGSVVIVLDDDPFSQIADTLRDYPDITRVTIVADGDTGVLRIAGRDIVSLPI